MIDQAEKETQYHDENLDLETQYHDENQSKTKEGQEDNNLNNKIPLPNITRVEMNDSNANMDGLNKTNKISGEMNDSNKDQDSEEPVEKIVVDLETEETKEETNVQEEVPTIDSITETNANQDSKGLTNQTNVSTKYHRVAGAAYNDNHGKLPTERSERIRSIFTPLQDYQGKEETNKAEETADTIIKADAMTHTFTATNTKKEGTDSQYEETMLASEEMTTN